MLVMQETAERLRQRREYIGQSQGQVAQYEGISQTYISALESGRNSPPVWPLLANLARRYRTSTDYLLGLTDDPRPVVQEERALREEYVTYEVTQTGIREQVQRAVALFVGLDEADRAFVLEMLELVGKKNQPRIIGDE